MHRIPVLSPCYRAWLAWTYDTSLMTKSIAAENFLLITTSCTQVAPASSTKRVSVASPRGVVGRVAMRMWNVLEAALHLPLWSGALLTGGLRGRCVAALLFFLAVPLPAAAGLSGRSGGTMTSPHGTPARHTDRAGPGQHFSRTSTARRAWRLRSAPLAELIPPHAAAVAADPAAAAVAAAVPAIPVMCIAPDCTATVVQRCMRCNHPFCLAHRRQLASAPALHSAPASYCIDCMMHLVHGAM